MGQHNSGDNSLELWDVQQGWIPFLDAYLTEATEYRLRYKGTQVDVRFHNIPLPFYQEQSCWFATLITPFQSGLVKIFINGQNYETFIYPDERKLTEEQFNWMLEEILEEANSCFQLSGLETSVSAFGRNWDISWTQWSYIDQSFYLLKQIFSWIEKQPIQRLEKFSMTMKREKVQHTEHVTLRWLDFKGYGTDIPSNVQNVKTLETRNLYENQVLKQQLQDLYRLLRKYEAVEYEAMARKARKYKAVVQRWLNNPFIKEIIANTGPYTITQKFRKHPVYRLWYQWFDRLNKHNREGIGFDYPISLKDTFQLYEMWCFMKIVKILRETDFVLDMSGLFRTTREGIFLNLAENNESRIKLKGAISLYYQRSYQYNSKTFHTYTQKMIPDIVLEGNGGIIVFDPKYRVPNNLGTALGEMHKYRDGILHRETGNNAVQEAYILTPTHEEHAEGMRYFRNDFHERFRMGAIQMLPGDEDQNLKMLLTLILNGMNKNPQIY
ncbi:DUF2357 domain-containing protein [Neobacillus vireti]|uniref:DUF2357 domain-containing protein n=1 Tax=Neobacillus vireti LMG 21834 TaxID=1131730 RepID=A0AB94IQW7_9BACI|nr:DUF2357 domain-containing protein [Neobacillus vireti]ETI69436.1 hypothetical protein BAVI_07656 [Neobacillus vireti LMG 21834]KLT18906.1 hypothetical protein AA980_06120 [Neobacillus vireti]